MDLQQQLESEISELQHFINRGKQQGEPKHLIRMYQNLIKSKEDKLKQVLQFHNKYMKI